jgi:hypothetical protein
MSLATASLICWPVLIDGAIPLLLDFSPMLPEVTCDPDPYPNRLRSAGRCPPAT